MGDIHHVNLASTNPAAPYLTWDTAATGLAQAVSLAEAGDIVLVTDGTYRVSNLAITNPIDVVSVNGAKHTVMDGWHSNRCLTIAHTGGLVRGFTIKNGYATNDGGGIYSSGTISHCMVVSNRADNDGGGIFSVRGVVRNTLIATNVAAGNGGLSQSGSTSPLSVESCTFVRNASGPDGSACVIMAGTVRNTILAHNTSPTFPDWAVHAQPFPDRALNFSQCVARPAMPGVGHLDGAPDFVDIQNGDFRLRPGSPGLDAGALLDWMAGDVDLQGMPRAADGYPDMGAFEGIPSTLTCNFSATPSEGTPPFAVVFQAVVAGTNTTGVTYTWDFEGDGADTSGVDLAIVTNLYGALGYHDVVLTVSNATGEVDSYRRSACVFGGAATTFVSAAGGHVPPYASWSDAATSLQAAVDYTLSGGACLIATGTIGLADTVLMVRPITLRGAGSTRTDTVIDGNNSMRCFLALSAGAALENLTVTRALSTAGAGLNALSGASVSNCLFERNTSVSYGGAASGGYGFRAVQCLFSNNYANSGGGLAVFPGSVVTNCMFMANRSTFFGGAVYAAGRFEAIDSRFHFNTSFFSYGGAMVSSLSGLIVRCAFLENRGNGNGGAGLDAVASRLEDCSFTSNGPLFSTAQGGGAYADSCVISSCVFRFNTAGTNNQGGGLYAFRSRVQASLFEGNSAVAGGGIYSGSSTVDTCIVFANHASSLGGGVQGAGLLLASTVASNTCASGGGIHGAWQIRNSIIYNNAGGADSNHAFSAYSADYSCTAPALTSGIGNVSAPPMFQVPSLLDFRLSGTSPCIDSGDPAAPDAADFDEVPRPLDGDNSDGARSDMGAYEYIHPLADSDGDGLIDTNEIADGTSPAAADTDGDGSGDGWEHVAGTDPLDASSVFELTSQSASPDSSAVVLRWSSVAARSYVLSAASNATSPFMALATNILPTPPENAYTDTLTAAEGRVYQVTVTP